jgi:type I restriction enzyme S subunit
MLRAGRLDDGIAWIAKEGARNHGLLNVGSADFFALYLDLPPLEEQRRIAEILDTIDETIQATERVIAKKERVRIGLVDELLGDRRVGTWSSVALESLTKLFADGDWIETPFIVDEGIRLIQTGNIGVGRFIDKPESRRYISAGAFASLGCTDVVPGDLLICRLADPVGRACIVPADVGRAITSVDCAIARVDASLADTKFLRLLMGTRSWLDKCERVAGGTTRKRISRSNLGALHVEIPGLKEQRRIADVVELVETDLERLREQGKKLRMIRRGLAVDLLSGRVRTVAA